MNPTNIVLVHGAWADGSSWSSVILRLQKEGYRVIAPQFPLTTVDANLARLREVLAVQSGPTLVVCHSFGGQIITALGADAPNVVGLVYIAGFGLDQGESINALILQGPPPPAVAHLRVDAQGYAWIPQDDFVKYFAAGVNSVAANVMYAVQQPILLRAFETTMSGAPAWKRFPSWYLVAKKDQVIPPDAERSFAKRMGATTIEIDSGHLAMVVHPDAVTDLIVRAAESVAEKVH